jgi:hypothetical protein
MSDVNRYYRILNSNSIVLGSFSSLNELVLLVATVQSELFGKFLKDVDIYFYLKFIPGKRKT